MKFMFHISLIVLLMQSALSRRISNKSRFMSSIEPATRGFLQDHCLKLRRTAVNSAAGTISPSVDIEFFCEDISREVIQVRICHSKCVDIESCEFMKDMKNEAVIHEEVVSDRHGNKFLLKLPLACHCVLVQP